MSPDSAHLTTIADSVVGALPCCDDPPLALALLLALADGKPIADSQFAATTGRDQDQVTAAFMRWPNVQRDEQGRVIAFSGLSLRPTAHRFELAGRDLFTWCAWDTLFLPAVLDQPARVRSHCPVTGAEVRLTVEPDRVRDRHPEALRVSFPPGTAVSTADITGSFCCHVHFLAGPNATERWLRDRPGTTALTLDEAFELGRHVTGPLLAGR
jgi:alkylmercury lyase